MRFPKIGTVFPVKLAILTKYIPKWIVVVRAYRNQREKKVRETTQSAMRRNKPNAVVIHGGTTLSPTPTLCHTVPQAQPSQGHRLYCLSSFDPHQSPRHSSETASALLTPPSSSSLLLGCTSSCQELDNFTTKPQVSLLSD